MKFKCNDCNEEWIVPKEEFIYIRNWPDTCPNCESLNINHGIVEEDLPSSGALENVKDMELEEIKHKKLEKCFKTLKREEVIE